MPILLRRKQRLRVHPLPANIQLLCLIPTALLHPAAATFEQGNPKTLVLTMTGVTHTQEVRPWLALCNTHTGSEALACLKPFSVY